MTKTLYNREYSNLGCDYMKRYIRSSIDAKDLKIRTEVWDSYDGWVQGAVVCEYNNDIVGKIDVQINNDEEEIYIDMIEVKPEYRRQGIATQMFDFLRKEFADYYVEWGFTTSDGTQLKEKLTNTIKNPEYDNLEKSINTINNLLSKCEEKLNDDEWLESVPQEEINRVSNRWQLLYDKKRDLEYDIQDLREYLTTWK